MNSIGNVEAKELICMTHGHELRQGCQTHFHQGPHEAHSCLQRAEIILGLYKCNYFLTVKELKLWMLFLKRIFK